MFGGSGLHLHDEQQHSCRPRQSFHRSSPQKEKGSLANGERLCFLREIYRIVYVSQPATFTPHDRQRRPTHNELRVNSRLDHSCHRLRSDSSFGFTTLIDEQIGGILAHLEETGRSRDTIVLFASDHGETAGSHGGLADKGWHHFEEIQHIPLMVRFPDGRSAGENRTNLVSLADLYPTTDSHSFCETDPCSCPVLRVGWGRRT